MLSLFLCRLLQSVSCLLPPRLRISQASLAKRCPSSSCPLAILLLGYDNRQTRHGTAQCLSAVSVSLPALARGKSCCSEIPTSTVAPDRRWEVRHQISDRQVSRRKGGTAPIDSQWRAVMMESEMRDGGSEDRYPKERRTSG
eukprot:scaffold286332_cov31-Tisochrysis_lutea.AAC.3